MDDSSDVFRAVDNDAIDQLHSAKGLDMMLDAVRACTCRGPPLPTPLNSDAASPMIFRSSHSKTARHCTMPGAPR